MPQFNTASIFDFVHVLILLGLRFRYSVTSWGRSPARNHAVGGHPNSYHMLFLAADVVLDAGESKVDFISDAKRLGLKALDEGDHIHLQPL